MFALIQNQTVRQISAATFLVHPDYQWIECDNTIKVGDGWDGQIFIPQAVPEKPMDEVLREYQEALQNFLDRKARERQYNNALSIATYVSSTNPIWKAEADAFVAWRDAVYVYALQILTDVQNGGSQPSIEEVIAAMPAMVWPN